MLWLNNTVPSAAKPAEVPTRCTVTYIPLPATAGASTVNVIAEASHIKNKQTKNLPAFPGSCTAVVVTALQIVQW